MTDKTDPKQATAPQAPAASPAQAVLPPQDPCPTWARIKHEVAKGPEQSVYLQGLLGATDDPIAKAAQAAAMIQLAQAELAEQQVAATFALQQTVMRVSGALGAMGQVAIQGNEVWTGMLAALDSMPRVIGDLMLEEMAKIRKEGAEAQTGTSPVPMGVMQVAAGCPDCQHDPMTCDDTCRPLATTRVADISPGAAAALEDSEKDDA